MPNEISDEKVLTRDELQGLYSLGGIETVHVVTGCDGLVLTATLGDGKVAQRMPEGNYILVRLVNKPTTRKGLFAIRAPEGSNSLLTLSTAAEAQP